MLPQLNFTHETIIHLVNHVMNHLKLLTFISFIALATVSCAPDDGGDAPQGDPGPSLDVDELTADGCLNIEKLMSRLGSESPELVTRRYSRDFSVDSQSVEGKPLRSSFVAIIPFSHFIYKEEPFSAYISDFGRITQDVCNTVKIEHDLRGFDLYRVVLPEAETEETPANDPKTLTLQRLANSDNSDGSGELKADGFEVTYSLKSERELEIITKQLTEDTCPPLAQVKSQYTQILTWGSIAELQSASPQISREYLKKIALAVRDMPQPLIDLARYSGESIVTALPQDLQLLRNSSLDPRHRCPYTSTPPSGEEPRPPQGQPQPPPSTDPGLPPVLPDPNSPPGEDPGPIMPDPEEPEPEDTV